MKESILNKLTDKSKEFLKELNPDFTTEITGLSADFIYTKIIKFDSPLTDYLLKIDTDFENLNLEELESMVQAELERDTNIDLDSADIKAIAKESVKKEVIADIENAKNDPNLAEAFSVLNKDISFDQLITNAYNEALLSRSDIVDIVHFQLGFLNLIDTDKYYTAKGILSKAADVKLQQQAELFYEDLNKTAKKNKTKFIGRENDLTKLAIKLSTPSSKPILLVGPEGIGKTSLVRELAKKIEDKTVPEKLLKTKILRVKFSMLSALVGTDGANSMGSQNITNLLNLIALVSKQEGYTKTILFLDELKFSNQFFIGIDNKSSRNDIKIIGAVDEDISARLYDGNIAKLWDHFVLKEQKKPELLKIFNSRTKLIKSEYKLNIEKEILERIIDENKENYNEAMPGIGLKLLDSLAIYKDYSLKLGHQTDAPTIITIEDYTKYKNLELDDQPSSISKEFADDIDIDFKRAEKYLKTNIIGQDTAISALVRSLKISSLKLLDSKRPIGTFLFVGPTGVGKSETAKVLAEALYGTDDQFKSLPNNFLRIDMTEYSEKHAVAKLFGAPPGYVGYDEGGLLIDFIANNPKGIILFDEIDKAHNDVLNSLLHILDEGLIRDSVSGEMLSITDQIIIMTSNHGIELLSQFKVGFGSEKEIRNSSVESERILIKNLKKELKPEFLNRFDEIIVFNKLTDENYVNVFDLLFKPVISNLKNREINLKISKAAKEHLIKIANTKEFGARDLKRKITKELLDPISDRLLDKKIVVKSIVIGMKNGKLYVK